MIHNNMTHKEQLIDQLKKVEADLIKQRDEIEEALVFIARSIRFKHTEAVLESYREFDRELDEFVESLTDEQGRTTTFTLSADDLVENQPPYRRPTEPFEGSRECAYSQCKVHFKPTEKHGKPHIYCTKTCGQLARREAERNARAVAPVTQIETKCVYCNSAFTYPSTHKGRPPEYCSDDCRGKMYYYKEKEKILDGPDAWTTTANDDLAAKLAEIKATCPAPVKRPEIVREL